MAADERVLSFLQQQNRPYNAQGVTDHLAQFGVKKAQAQKALDALSEAGKIKCKEFGKTKIYTALQEDGDDLSKEEMEALQKANAELAEKAQAVSSAVRAKQKELQALECSLTVEEIAAKTEELQSQMHQAEEKLHELRSGSKLVTAEERAAVESAFLAATDAWAKRKRMFKSIWDQVSENIEQNAQNLFEEMGVETDEGCNADLKQVQQLMPKRIRR